APYWSLAPHLTGRRRVRVCWKGPLCPWPTGARITFDERENIMTTPELSSATPADVIAALPPADDIVVLMLGPIQHPTEVPLRAAIRCPLAIDPDHAQRFPAACHLSAAQFPTALLVDVCDLEHDRDALRRHDRVVVAARGLG